MAHVDELLKTHAATQVAMMEEEVILVDPNDVVLGKASKKICTNHFFY